jgi:hypothetical protein
MSDETTIPALSDRGVIAIAESRALTPSHVIKFWPQPARDQNGAIMLACPSSYKHPFPLERSDG